MRIQGAWQNIRGTAIRDQLNVVSQGEGTDNRKKLTRGVKISTALPNGYNWE